jgi:hypothetical protein
LESAISVHEKKYRPSGNPNPVISGSGNSSVRLSDDAQWEAIDPLTNHFGGGVATAIIYHNDFKVWPMHLLCQGTQTGIECDPVVVDSYDDAEDWHRS